MREEKERVLMSIERVPVEVCKGVNGLEKVVLREVRGSSAEVKSFSCNWIWIHLFVGSSFLK